MEWTPRSIAAAFVGTTAVVNVGILYWLFRDDTLLLGVGIVFVVVGSLGGYRSLSQSLAGELGSGTDRTE